MAAMDGDIDFGEGSAIDELEEGQPLAGFVGDEEVVVVRQGDEIFAVGAHCTHYGGPLAEGLVDGKTIRCPLHHAVFDLSTGQALGAPAFSGVGCYGVEINGDRFVVGPKEKEKAHGEAAQSPESVLIVGAGAAAAAAAEMLRRQGYDGPITMIGHESSGPVDRPNLSKDFLAGDAQPDWIPLGGDDHWQDLDVTLIKGVEIVAIDREKKELRSSDGSTYGYDRLLYAMGAAPQVPPIDGLESARHYSLRSFADSEAILEAAETSERALVLGASFIGLEVAASLKKQGLDVTVVAPEEVPLAAILGEAVGQAVQAVHEEEGVEFMLGQTVEKFSPSSATLANGEDVAFDFVVCGTGVRPRTELAEKAGLSVDDGVVVDRHMRTDDEAIYAAGDVARVPQAGSDKTVRIEHWVFAERLGERAARAMVGADEPTEWDVPFFWSRHFDMTIQYVGHAGDFEKTIVAGSLAEGDAAVGYVQDGQIVAVATVGRPVDNLRAELALARAEQEKLREIVGQ